MPSFAFIATAFALYQIFGICFCAAQNNIVSIELQHGSVAVLPSSLNQKPIDYMRAAAAAAAVASASLDEVRASSDFVFHKAKYITAGSTLLGEDAAAAPGPLYKRNLDAQYGDQQFFVQFSTPTDAYTLLAFHELTGRPIVSHVHDSLYIAMGGSTFAEEARSFPGVLWVQAREESSKLSSILRSTLERAALGLDPVPSLIAECWLEGCLHAASEVKKLCPAVYVHPTLVEAVCSARAFTAAVSVLARHIAVDHVDVKHGVTTANFGGRAIISSGVNASAASPLRVLSSINVSDSVIAVADSGIDMNNCFFYDPNATEAPWSNSRVVKFYEATAAGLPAQTFCFCNILSRYNRVRTAVSAVFQASVRPAAATMTTRAGITKMYKSHFSAAV
jgi:hypothetical protein